MVIVIMVVNVLTVVLYALACRSARTYCKNRQMPKISSFSSVLSSEFSFDRMVHEFVLPNAFETTRILSCCLTSTVCDRDVEQPSRYHSVVLYLVCPPLGLPIKHS